MAYLVTSAVGNAVRLPVVLGHVGVHEGDNVRADGGSHHAWQSDCAYGRAAVSGEH